MPWYKYWLLILFLFGVSHLLYSQEKSCTITITVVDSVTRVPLPNAIASFQTKTPSEMTWAYTDAKGQVSYTPPTGDTVRGSFSYLGYAEKTIALWCANEAPTERVVLLAANDLPLREVVITEQLPAVVEKKDTTIYKVDSFATGRERNLKQILRGLPGVEVDQRNQVYVKGQKVQEVLVEGETFFTGDAALAVKNVPADVVDRIEVLDKYNDIGMLQGQDSGDRLALNVRLKQDKQKFIFGEVKASTNATERHQLKPSLFYYSPQLRINGIGEYTTTEQTGLTPGEVTRFMGLELNQYDPSQQQTLVQDLQLMQNVLPSSAFFDQEALLGVLQGQYTFKNKTSLDIIGLGMHHDLQARRRTVRTFLDAATGIEESQRQMATTSERTFVRGKINSDPGEEYFLSYEWQFTDLPVKQSDSVETVFLGQRNAIAQVNDRTQKGHGHEVRWVQQWHDRLQSIVQVRYRQQEQRQNESWQFGERPAMVVDTLASSLLQVQSNHTDRFYALARFNYRVAKKSRAFVFFRWDRQDHGPAAGVTLNTDDQAEPGYGYPATTFRAEQWVSGARYLWQPRKWTLNLGLDYVQGRWGQEVAAESWSTRGILAPSLNVSRTFSGIGKINLDYSYSLQLPDYTQSVPGLLFQEFNQLQTGIPGLRAGQTQQISLSLKRSRLLSGKTFSAFLMYRHVANPLLQQLQLRGSSLVWVTENSTEPMQDANLMLLWMRMRRAFKVVSRVNMWYSHFQQSIDDVPVPVTRLGASNNLRISYTTQRQEASLLWRMSLQNTPQNAASTDWFVDNTVSGEYRIFWSDRWQSGLQADYRLNCAQTLSQDAVFIHADLQYTTQDERIVFGLRVYNLLNQRWVGSNQVTTLSNISTNRRLMSRFVQGQISYLF